MIGEGGADLVGSAERWRAGAHELLEIRPETTLAGARAKQIGA
jgi:hypothetical protein